MNREQMIDHASNAIRVADGGHTMGAGALAEVVVDALLPQVTTVEELVTGMALVDCENSLWLVKGSKYDRLFCVSSVSRPGWTQRSPNDASAILAVVGPLTVVWQP